MIKVLWWRFQKYLGPFTVLLVDGSFETELFRHLYHHLFRVCKFGNRKISRVIFFFQNVQNLILISKMQKKSRFFFVVFEIIASQLVSLNFLC